MKGNGWFNFLDIWIRPISTSAVDDLEDWILMWDKVVGVLIGPLVPRGAICISDFRVMLLHLDPF